MQKRPGGRLTARPLHFIWIADCSSSMKGEKIDTLNLAIKDAIPEMRRVAGENPNAEIHVRAIEFSSGTSWHVEKPTPLDTFAWPELRAGGVTDMGKAFSLLAEELDIDAMEARALPPVLVLLSDGQPTDDYMRGLMRLNAQPWAAKAVRVAIAVGSDADYEVLSEFLNHSELAPLSARNASALVNYIKWVSTVVLQSASMPALQGESIDVTHATPIPEPPTIDVDEVW